MNATTALAAAATVVLLAGCSSRAERLLQGRWLGDNITNLDAAQLPQAIGWVRGASFEFASSNVTVAIPTELPRSGEYDVVQSNDNEVVIAVHRPDGALDKARFSFDSEQQLRWHLDDGRAILMRRVD
jgi:hypothetical protein